MNNNTGGSDVDSVIIQPFLRFVRDSTHLVKKCTKPDAKGNSNSVIFFYPSNPCYFLDY